MNIIDIVKSMIYSKQLAELELNLLEMQSAYNTLNKKKMDLYLELKEKDKYIKELENKINTLLYFPYHTKLKEKDMYIKELENKISTLRTINDRGNKYVTQIQETFQNKINELKIVSDNFFSF